MKFHQIFVTFERGGWVSGWRTLLVVSEIFPEGWVAGTPNAALRKEMGIGVQAPVQGGNLRGKLVKKNCVTGSGKGTTAGSKTPSDQQTTRYKTHNPRPIPQPAFHILRKNSIPHREKHKTSGPNE